MIDKLIKLLKLFIPYSFKTFYKKNYREFNASKLLDKKMLKFINYNNGYFIEIGAHDGIHHSNTLYYEKYKNWSGILIEPSEYFKNLIKNRSKKNKFFNCGCGEFGIDENEILIESGDRSFVKKYVENNLQNFFLRKGKQANHKFKEKKIKLRNLNSILTESEAPIFIDFFSLDVEGSELKVLKGNDFNKFNFKFILVECVNEKKFNEVYNFLTGKNYELVEKLTPWDILFRYSS